MKKKILSVIMALAMMLTLLPVTAMAEDTWQEVSDSAGLTQALQSGGNIRVTTSIEMTTTETVEISKPVVLDLNGQTVTWNSSAKEVIKVQNGGDLTIQDASDDGALHFTSTSSKVFSSAISAASGGSLTLTGGTVSCEHQSASTFALALYVSGSGVFSMSGGKVLIAGKTTHAFYLASSAPVNITGGTLEAGTDITASTVYGLYVYSGNSVNIQNFTADMSQVPASSSAYPVYTIATTPIDISSGTYTTNEKNSSYAVGSSSSNAISISGGTFNGAVKAASGKITGGMFSNQPSAAYLPLGKIYAFQQDNYYHVVDGNYVARIGTVGYLTWDELFEAASTSSTASWVYIMSPIDEVSIPEDANIVFYNSDHFAGGRIINYGTCKVCASNPLPGMEIVNYGALSLNDEIGSLINNVGGMVTATLNSPKVTGTISNHGAMTISMGTYLGSITNDGTLTITGGTFSQDVKALCAEGYTTQQNKAGTWDVMADVPHVAEIDGYWYGSLSSALAAAQSGDTVKLLDDTTLTTKVSVSNKTLTLDMNGHKITYGASGRNYGALVFVGTSDITITGNGFFGFDNSYADSSATTGRIFDANNGTVLTIENGTFYAGLTCVLADNNAKVIIKGGSYSASQVYPDSGNWFLLNLQDKTGAQIVVYGGTFAQYNPAESRTEPGEPVSFCAEGYTVTSEVKENVTYYTVGPDSTQAFAAEIGGLKYVSLDKALEAAKDGDTVTLLSKYEGEPVTIAKAITIDLAATDTASDKFVPEAAYQMTMDGTKLVFGLKNFTITFESNGGSDVAAQTVTYNGTATRPADPTRSGYTFGGWYSDETLTTAYDFSTLVTGDITLYAKWTAIPSGGSSSSGNKTETVTNPDGSTTTTVTRPDGSTTETTKNPDGSTEVVNTDKTGNVTTTTTDKTGNKTETVEKTDGTSQTTVTNKDDSSSTTTVDETGKTEAQVKLPAAVVNAAAEKGETVTLPMPEVPVTSDKAAAPTVSVDLPADTSAKVEIPVENVTAGTVAMRMLPDGTAEVIQTTVATENGIAVTLSDGDTVKIVDNSKDFVDVSDAYWGSDEIDFAASRELMSGTSATTFSPEGDMTRAMVVTVLARYEGEDTSAGDTWYEAGAAWAVENGVSDGTNLMDSITREQLATMLYRYAGEPEVTGTITGFKDAGEVSDWAEDAMVWATQTGIIGGMGDGVLNPKGTATRAQVATILMRFVSQTN